MKTSSLIFTGSLLLALSACGNNDNTDDGLNGPTTDTSTGVDHTYNSQNGTMPMGDSTGTNGTGTNGTGNNNGMNGSNNNNGTNNNNGSNMNGSRGDTTSMPRR